MRADVSPPPVEPVSVAELRAYLRLDGSAEDVVLAGLVRAARGLAEGFTGKLLIARAVVETVAPGGRLTGVPFVSVALVEAVAADGAATVLAPGAYSLAVDADGVARISGGGADTARVRVTYRAGMADDWNGVPDALRQGVIRLASHMFTQRDGAGEAVPTVVAALWRPFRLMRLN